MHNYRESETIKRLCETCELCVKAKKTPKQIPIAKFPIPVKPFHTISSDILGPLPITSEGNRYILVIRDYTTRYTILFALRNKEAESIIEALRLMMSNYGSSEVLVTDNAQEFVSEKNQAFLQIL